MLPFDDVAASLDGPRSARMEQRTRPHVKETIEAAAAVMGVDATAFVTNAAYERARETLRSHELTVLGAADRDAFLAALENPPPPSDRLREAFRRHDARVINDE